MAGTQLAIRFTDEQIETIDGLASEQHLSRSAVVKRLVEAARRERVAAVYRAAYRDHPIGVDDFGDLEAFHADAEADRVESRADQSSW